MTLRYENSFVSLIPTRQAKPGNEEITEVTAEKYVLQFV